MADADEQQQQPWQQLTVAVPVPSASFLPVPGVCIKRNARLPKPLHLTLGLDSRAGKSIAWQLPQGDVATLHTSRKYLNNSWRQTCMQILQVCLLRKRGQGALSS